MDTPAKEQDYEKFTAKGKQVWISFKEGGNYGNYAIANVYTEELAIRIANALNAENTNRTSNTPIKEKKAAIRDFGSVDEDYKLASGDKDDIFSGL
jgi:hypothetical protein